MKTLFAALYLLLLLPACQSIDPYLSEQHHAITSGTEAPAAEYTLSTAEENAVVAMGYIVYGQRYQGCTGTLIGDRVIVTASHCLINNIDNWLTNGDEPTLIPYNMMRFYVGADIDQPICELEVEKASIHPNAAPNGSYPSTIFSQIIDHDIGIVILKQSVLEQCQPIIPAKIANTISLDQMKDQLMLIGGFGALDDTYNFSPKRYWAQINFSDLNDDFITTQDIGKGDARKGDSGTGLLYRDSDTKLYHLGVDSLGNQGYGAYIRTDKNLDFIDNAATKDEFCGSFTTEGRCIDGKAFNCDSDGKPDTDDCQAQGLGCFIENTQAVCKLEPTKEDESGCQMNSTTALSQLWPLILLALAAAIRRSKVKPKHQR